MKIKKFDQIDGLRFFAVFGVLCAHWALSFGDLLYKMTLAGRGVDLFFVISGFLITLGLIRSKEEYGLMGTKMYKFYIRRALRIFPLYYLTILVLLFFYHDQILTNIWWYVLYIWNFHIIKVQDWGIAGHVWSLSVEEQFYFVWPFIILFLPDSRLIWVIISAVFISLIAKIYWFCTGAAFWSEYVHPLGTLDVLALGGLLAYLYHFHNEWLRKTLYNPMTGTILALQIILCIYLDGMLNYKFIHLVVIRTSFGLFSMWLIGRAAFGFTGIWGFILNSRPVRYVGKISYAIYIIHPFVPGMLERFKYPQGDNMRFVMYSAVTLAMASLSWYLFESRILKLKDRFE
jgi:peptidoglycan/LPS O-acetylase OafA/YrhL